MALGDRNTSMQRRLRGLRGFGRAKTNEKKYPHIVEVAVSKIGLDVGLGRRIMNFHNSRHIKPRHGCINFSGSGAGYGLRCVSLRVFSAGTIDCPTNSQAASTSVQRDPKVRWPAGFALPARPMTVVLSFTHYQPAA
jgi:hypothetical protein